MNRSSKLLINEPPLQVLPSLAVAIGLNEAIFMQQLQYWLSFSKHEHDGRVWIYNSKPEWGKQFPFWSESTLKRVIVDVRERGLVITRSDLNAKNLDQTLWYTIDYDVLDKVILTLPSVQSDLIIGSKWTDGSGQNEPTNTNRIQQQNTQQNNNKRKGKAAPPHPMTQPIIQTYIELLGYTPSRDTMTRAVGPTAKEIATKGYTNEDVRDMYMAMKLDEFWKDKTISLSKVLDKILETRMTIRNRKEADHGTSEDLGGWTPEEIERVQTQIRERTAAHLAQERANRLASQLPKVP